MGQGFTVVIDFCFLASLCAASRRPRELVLQMVANRQQSEEDVGKMRRLKQKTARLHVLRL